MHMHSHSLHIGGLKATIRSQKCEMIERTAKQLEGIWGESKMFKFSATMSFENGIETASASVPICSFLPLLSAVRPGLVLSSAFVLVFLPLISFPFPAQSRVVSVYLLCSVFQTHSE